MNMKYFLHLINEKMKIIKTLIGLLIIFITLLIIYVVSTFREKELTSIMTSESCMVYVNGGLTLIIICIGIITLSSLIIVDWRL